MKKLLYILIIGAVATIGVLVAKAFFSGVKDGYDEARLEHQTESKVVAESDNQNDKKIVEPQAETPDEYSPAIWKIEHGEKTSYLFGSIHVGDKSMYPLPDKIMNAFNASDTLAVEIDMDQGAMMELAQYINKLAIDMENPLSETLSAKTKERYDNYCEQEKLSCSSFEHYEPWYLFMNFGSMIALKAGLNPNLGIDKHFVDKARNNKPIVALESVKSQITMFDGFSKPLQDSLLYGVMAPVDMKSEMKELAVAWKTGNVEQFLSENLEQMAEGEEALPEAQMQEYLEKFMYSRNQVMANGISDIIKQGQSVFAVVGAAHYAGEKSVNEYLEKLGYKVERI